MMFGRTTRTHLPNLPLFLRALRGPRRRRGMSNPKNVAKPRRRRLNNDPIKPGQYLLLKPQVLELCGNPSYGTVWLWMKEAGFPHPIELGPRNGRISRVAWLAAGSVYLVAGTTSARDRGSQTKPEGAGDPQADRGHPAAPTAGTRECGMSTKPITSAMSTANGCGSSAVRSTAPTSRGTGSTICTAASGSIATSGAISCAGCASGEERSGAWRSEGPVVIAPHFMAQGCIDAGVETGRVLVAVRDRL